MNESKNSSKVYILLASYKGELFVRQQIESVINQKYTQWELWIRDDCSEDLTLEIIEQYATIDGRIKILDNKHMNLGACQNFAALLNAIPEDSNYIMFCDQDDIWLPDKIERSLREMKKQELQFGSNNSILIYGTYRMIDEVNHPIEAEVPDYSITPTFQLILSQNYIYGCTMLLNNALFRYAKTIPVTAENHDYWVVLSALAHNGYFQFIADPLLLYRQHSSNVSGSYTNSSPLNRIKRLFSRTEIYFIQKRLLMYDSLFQQTKEKLLPQNYDLLNGYITNVKKGGLRAFWFCYRNKIRRRGMFQTILFYFNLLRT